MNKVIILIPALLLTGCVNHLQNSLQGVLNDRRVCKEFPNAVIAKGVDKNGDRIYLMCENGKIGRTEKNLQFMDK